MRRRRQATIRQLEAQFEMDAALGVLLRRSTTSRGPAGSRAGGVTPQGYRSVNVTGVGKVREHRVIWAMANGRWPEDHMDVDHINGDPLDNRPCNLRLATASENAQNRRGAANVTKRQDSTRWDAAVKLNGRRIHVGSFATRDEAYAAYVAAKRRLHPFWSGPWDGVAS